MNINIYPENFRNFPENEKQTWMSVKDWVEAESKEFAIESAEYPNLYQFKLVSSRKNIAAKKSAKVSDGKNAFTLLVAKFEIIHEKFSRFNKTSRDIKEEFTHFGGYIELKNKELGRAFFRPEALKGSLSITLEEISINEDISKTHRQFVENKDAFLGEVEKNVDVLQEILKQHPNLNIEFNGEAVLFSTLKPISHEELKTTIAAGLKLNELFG